MNRSLDIHRAGPAELIDAHNNVYDIWSMGLSPQAHLERRLTAPHHRRADWWVGTLGGQVVVSLASHPFEFQIGAESRPGIAIASVYTRREHRGRGYAAALIGEVERDAAIRGAEVSILYSDIAPAYYERLGYAATPAHESRTLLSAGREAAVATIELERFNGSSGLGRMMGFYQASHGGAPLSLARSPDYWQYLLQREPQHEFYWLRDGASLIGYVRLSFGSSGVKVADWAFAESSGRDVAILNADDDGWRKLAPALHCLAAERQMPAILGWLPDLPGTREAFTLAPRMAELPMLRWLVSGQAWTSEQLACGDRFCEIDHV